jgi:hypothetical protein
MFNPISPFKGHTRVLYVVAPERTAELSKKALACAREAHRDWWVAAPYDNACGYRFDIIIAALPKGDDLNDAEKEAWAKWVQEDLRVRLVPGGILSLQLPVEFK